MTRDSLLKGTLILAAGNLISRGLGAIYRFFLPFLFGGGVQAQVGVALFNFAYPLYTALLAVSAAGIPPAIAKMVAESTARGDRRGALAVFRLAMAMLALLGLACSVLLYAVAPLYAGEVARDPRATMSLRAIAPAVFLVSLMSAYRGYLQGLQRMVPYAVSQVLEQAVRIATMFLFAWMLLPRGIEFAAAGATFGAVTGAAAGLLYLMWVMGRLGRAGETGAAGGGGEGVAVSALFGRLFRLAIPISLVGIVQPLMSMIDSVVVPGRLHAAGLGAEATRLYGILTGYALPFMIAPTVFAAALATSLLPSISAATSVGDSAGVQRRYAAGIRLTLMMILPAAFGVLALAREIPTLFYDAPEAGLPLAVLALGTIFLGLQQTSSAVLQGLGAVAVPVRSLLAGAGVKLAVTWWLTAVPALHVNGAAAGTVAGSLVAVWLNHLALDRLLGAKTRWLELGGRTFLAALLMVAAVRLAYAGLFPLAGLKPATMAAILVGMASYPVALVLLGGVTPRDLEMLPWLGERLGRYVSRLPVLRGR